ncbi:hypothetical protein, partial [Cytobacillus praedii]
MPKKHSYEFVKSVIENRGKYRLISKEYIDARTKLEIICPNDHTFYMTFDNFKKGCDCKYCANDKRKKPFLSHQQVKHYIEFESNSNCLLLSKEYTGVTQKLKIKCPCNNIFTTDFHNFKLGKNRCNECNGITNWNYVMVKEFVNAQEYDLISENYTKSIDKLSMQCPNGHIIDLSFYDFKRGNRCAKCAGNKKHTIEEVAEFIVERESNYK